MENKLEPRAEDRSRPLTRVDIIIPTLNEEDTIAEILAEVSQIDLPIKASALVIDGGSTDKTLEICRAANARVIHQKSRGKGAAMREAVDFSDAELIVFIDGDGTYSISELDALLNPLLLGEADMVVGSRLRGNLEKGAITQFNMIGNKLFNRAINFSMKSNITDSLSGYRALSRRVFREFVLFSSSFEIEVEMMVEALGKRYRVMEVPVTYTKRRKGSTTKLNPLNDGIQIGKTLTFILMNVYPLKFFGIISLVFVVLGLYPALLVIDEKISTGTIVSMPSVVFASLLFVTAAICLVLGILSELIVASRRRLEALLSRDRRGMMD